MKLRIKRKSNKVNEEDIAVQSITDPTLLNASMILQNEKQKVQTVFDKAQEVFNKAQETYNKEMKTINDKLLEIINEFRKIYC